MKINIHGQSVGDILKDKEKKAEQAKAAKERAEKQKEADRIKKQEG